MAIVNDYNTLAQQIQKYLNRNDTATVNQIPMFIAIAETNVYRDLLVPTMEARALYKIGLIDVSDAQDGSEMELVDKIRVPHNFLTLRSMTIPDHNQVVRPKAWTEFTREKATESAITDSYARDGDTFFFDPVPDTEVELQMLYYRSFDDLSPANTIDDNDPRPFLTVTYDAWLYGALVEAATYLGDERLNFFMQRYEAAIATLSNSATELELSGGPLIVSIDSD